MPGRGRGLILSPNLEKGKVWEIERASSEAKASKPSRNTVCFYTVDDTFREASKKAISFMKHQSGYSFWYLSKIVFKSVAEAF